MNAFESEDNYLANAKLLREKAKVLQANKFLKATQTFSKQKHWSIIAKAVKLNYFGNLIFFSPLWLLVKSINERKWVHLATNMQ